MYRKYYSYNDMPKPVPAAATPEGGVHKKPAEAPKLIEGDNKKPFTNLETDDIILLAVILLLLANDCEDKLLLPALAFVFLGGF